MTSWTTMGGETAGAGAIEVWRPTATSGQFQLIAVGPDQAVPAGAAVTHAVNIPVQPGDHIGVHTGADGGFDQSYPGDDFDLVGRVDFNAAIGQTVGPEGDFPISEQTNYRVNAAATLTAPDLPAAIKKKKCKKKKHKRSAESAKKKCKKRKKR